MKVAPAFIKSVVDALKQAAGGDPTAAEEAAQAVLADLQAKNTLCIVFFSLPHPVETVVIHAVSAVSGEVFATDRVNARMTAVLKNICSEEHILLEFEGLDSAHRVVAMTPGIPLNLFKEGNNFNLLAPIANEVEALNIGYSAIIES